MPNASIIVPVLNEESGLKKAAGQINELLKKSEETFEVIFVDDGSTDSSLDILKGFNASAFKIVSHRTTRGYGAAIKTGIKHAKYDTIIITDADCTYPIEKIPMLLQVYREGNCDMVVGSRSSRQVQIPLIRRPAKWFLKCLAEYLSDRKIPDLNSGLRVMRKEVVERFMNLLPNGFSFTTTITLAMLTNSYSVDYVEINYKFRRGSSKLRPIYDVLNFFQLIIRTTLYFNPLKIFVPLSLFLAFAAFMILVLSWLLCGRIMDVTFGVFLMASILVMSIGMLADLIDKRVG